MEKEMRTGLVRLWLTFYAHWMSASRDRYTPFIPLRALFPSPLPSPSLSPPLDSLQPSWMKRQREDPQGAHTHTHTHTCYTVRCSDQILTLRGRGARACVSVCVYVCVRRTHTHTHMNYSYHPFPSSSCVPGNVSDLCACAGL